MTRGRKKKTGETDDRKATTDPVEVRGGQTPEGPDRILVFADSLAGKAQDDEVKEQKLETWVTFHLDKETFALPVSQVQEILRLSTITRVPHAPFTVLGVANRRGHVLPVVDLRLRLGLKPAEPGPAHRILVASSKGRIIGLLVDSVEQVLQIDLLEVTAPPDDILTERSRYIKGVSTQRDGLTILLDADQVLQIRDEDVPPEAAREKPKRAGKQRRS